MEFYHLLLPGINILNLLPTKLSRSQTSRNSISKRSAYVFHTVHRSERCSIFSKASTKNPTALLNVEVHNQGSCEGKIHSYFAVSGYLCRLYWITGKKSHFSGLLWQRLFLFSFALSLLPLKCTDVRHSGLYTHTTSDVMFMGPFMFVCPRMFFNDSFWVFCFLALREYLICFSLRNVVCGLISRYSFVF